MRTLFKLFLLAIIPVATSCGGAQPGGSATQASSKGKAIMTIKWPARNARVIPTAANSIVVTLTQGSKTIATSGPIARPANGGTSTWTTPGLQPGTYAIQAQAFPQSNGTGTAQASGGSSIAIAYNHTTQASVTMGSTVTAIKPTPGNILARPSMPLTVSAAATDSAGDVVLVADSDIQWKIADPSVMKLVAGGVNAQFQGLRVGSTTVTCTFTGVESSLGQSAISSPPAKASVTTPGVAGTAWPTYWGNLQGNAASVATSTSGQVAWTQQPQGGAQIQAIGPDGTVIEEGGLGGNTEGVLAVNPDGSSKWTYSYNSALGSLLVASDGSVYVPNSQGLVVLNPADGSVVTTYPTGAKTRFTLGSDGTIYWFAGQGGTTLNAMGPDGSTKWSVAIVEPGMYEPVIAPDGTIYVSGYSNGTSQSICLIAVSSSGQIKWSTSMNQGAGLANSEIAIGPDGTIYTDGNENLLAYDPDGTLKWTSTQLVAGYGHQGFCIDSQGYVYGAYNGGLDKFDPKTGVEQEIVSAPTDGSGGICSSLAISKDNIIYCWKVVDSSGSLCAYDTSGDQVWSLSMPGTSSFGMPMIGPDGSIYFDDDTGTETLLYKIGGSGSSPAARKP